MLTILRAFFEFRPIDIGAILLRNATIILFDAAFHFLKDRFYKLGLRRHLCFKIRVFGFQMIEDFLVINRGIACIAQPMIFIGYRHIVMGRLMRTLCGDGWLDMRVGCFGHGFFLGECGRG